MKESKRTDKLINGPNGVEYISIEEFEAIEIEKERKIMEKENIMKEEEEKIIKEKQEQESKSIGDGVHEYIIESKSATRNIKFFDKWIIHAGPYETFYIADHMKQENEMISEQPKITCQHCNKVVSKSWEFRVIKRKKKDNNE